ncbi:hypothetical protein Pmani_010916 [Petrolisthes manimaculis]|uniref:Uncharacterized protein n=1 Tax=Petrolisthes manimaculis TaxID=1843537 RepID=A0AAE1P9W9_9EUCA|nr:hypothetical protein Pmani_024665 [Petrolisthes manimaculis]KAK4318039.1 hypothetical protein Pmani_010916 [Petrolisthes manimaculis]
MERRAIKLKRSALPPSHMISSTLTDFGGWQTGTGWRRTPTQPAVPPSRGRGRTSFLPSYQCVPPAQPTSYPNSTPASSD